MNAFEFTVIVSAGVPLDHTLPWEQRVEKELNHHRCAQHQAVDGIGLSRVVDEWGKKGGIEYANHT